MPILISLPGKETVGMKYPKILEKRHSNQASNLFTMGQDKVDAVKTMTVWRGTQIYFHVFLT